MSTGIRTKQINLDGGVLTRTGINLYLDGQQIGAGGGGDPSAYNPVFTTGNQNIAGVKTFDSGIFTGFLGVRISPRASFDVSGSGIISFNGTYPVTGFLGNTQPVLTLVNTSTNVNITPTLALVRAANPTRPNRIVFLPVSNSDAAQRIPSTVAALGDGIDFYRINNSGTISASASLLSRVVETGDQVVLSTIGLSNTSGQILLSQSGNVGINTVLPRFPLEVNGNASVSGLYINDQLVTVTGYGLYINGQLFSPEAWQAQCSDLSTQISVGANKASFRMPFSMYLTGVCASAHAPATGTNIIIDINQSGTSILSPKITITTGQETSLTAVTQPVVTSTGTFLPRDTKITVDFDQVGSTYGGLGIGVTLLGWRAVL